MLVLGIRMLTKFPTTPNYEKRGNFTMHSGFVKKQRNLGTNSYNDAKSTID